MTVAPIAVKMVSTPYRHGKRFESGYTTIPLRCPLVRLTYGDMFRHSDMFNPISCNTLLLAGKLADLGRGKRLLDLGCGKGFPSMLWASMFGVKIDGFDLNREYVKHANSRARLLNLEHLVKYQCRDVRQLKLFRKYHAIASLGLGIIGVYGTARKALRGFSEVLRPGGFLILAEPVWLSTPVPKEVQEDLGTHQASLCSRSEMEHLIESCGFMTHGSFVSTKEDWECYVRPVLVAMQELERTRPELAGECRKAAQSFQAECFAAGRDWDMILWVAKSHH